MKAIYFLSFSLVSIVIFSQQQQGNIFAQNLINAPVQVIQTNIGNLNTDNINDNNPIVQQQQINFIDNNIGNMNEPQQISNSNKQTNDVVNSNGKGFDLSFNFSSRSSRSSSNKKTHKHTFHKKLTKFNRNLYGKMTLHKKSKHLVDVCFNWSK